MIVPRAEKTGFLLGAVMMLMGATSRAEPPPCNLCEHLCMWAPIVMSAEKTKQIFDNPEIVAGVPGVMNLDAVVNATMSEWAKSSDAESPCYDLVVKDFLGGDSLNTADLNRVVSSMPPSGNVLHVAHDKKGCPIEPARKGMTMDKVKESMCPALFDALMAHEGVHKQQCEAAWKAGGKKAAEKFFSNPAAFAISESQAYGVQIAMMKESMKKLIDRKGCEMDSHSVEDFLKSSKPPDAKEALEKGKKRFEEDMKIKQALDLANKYNSKGRK